MEQYRERRYEDRDRRPDFDRDRDDRRSAPPTDRGRPDDRRDADRYRR